MKTLLFTTAVWLMVATVCRGQVRGVEAGSAEAYDLIQRQLNPTAAPSGSSLRQQAAARKRRHDYDVGRRVFGEDARWTASRAIEGGTLLGKLPSDFAIGDWGCTSTTFRLISRVSESAVLVTTTQDSPRVMLIRGLDTAKATDDIEFIFQHPVVIEQTYTYTAVSGAQKTVLVLDCNSSSFEEKLEKRVENSRSRTWKVGKETFVGIFVELKNGKVRLWRRDNRTFVEVSLSRLSRADQKYARKANPWNPPSQPRVDRGQAESGSGTGLLLKI